MDWSGDVVYEALGSYIDDLHGSVFIGTARGRVILYKNGTYNLTPAENPPFLNIFYRDGMLCISGVWSEGKETEAVMIRMVPSGMEVRDNVIYLTFKPRKGGIVMVALYGNEGLGKTLESVVSECREYRENEKIISSRVSR